ncbi:glycoside hydrolase family 2 TIM barrel-domain containing protein [Thalassotalea hakodatensis]|uniref:glycoside hydrolase family 2 TIM barrel-domain containing protein n=1 Tax=Thalassotalea hakodatensis TaxID=3030492 RepID=UPI002573A5C6|nr:glycoside hydrolase family 2 TIM barrel-domain containing protein [Thalassotalea hakodatensis]
MYKFIIGLAVTLISLFAYFFFGASDEVLPKEKSFIVNSRVIQPLNNQWQFSKTSPVIAHSIAKENWQTVNLPHTWNAKDGQDGGGDYYRGTGTYKRTFTLDEKFTNKKIYLHFDGATTTATVYVNGKEVGQHKGNYAAFRFDITKQVKLGQDNIVVVTVNNEVDDTVAPLSADFTFFGGLYRKVRLIASNNIHIDNLDYASSGVYWSQTNISNEKAELDVRTKLFNENSEAATITITNLLRDANNTIVAKTSEQLQIKAQASVEYTSQIALENPHLWHGLDDPYLYQGETTISHNGKVVDQINQQLGLRYFRVDKDQGFILNGKPYPLYGINRMADFPKKGTAINQEDHERDIQLMLELGATGVRLGHQQRDDYVYQRADEIGLVIWAEVPLINRINTNQAFTDNVKQQALELVRQNYNHSSIMFWGLFNEITLKPGPDPRPIVKELNTLVKAEDPNRLTTAAVAASGEKALQDPLATTTDITSFNRYYAWYYGSFSDFTKFMDHARESAPDLSIALSEFGAGASDKIHTDTPTMQDHSEEYQAIFHEHYWQDLQDRDYVWGKFLWVLADFAVDNRDEGDTPGRNDKGLVTFDRKVKKDAFFWYKANWAKEPVTHITGRRFSTRTQALIDIKVYSNQAELELFVNKQSLGKLELNGNKKIIWPQVELTLGDNLIEVANNQGKIVDSIHLTRVNSTDTKISAKLLGIDTVNGKIYNLPHGISFSTLPTVLEYPRDSSVELIKGQHELALNSGDIIKVTAQDGKTSQEYTFDSAALSAFKPTSASAEIAANLSIGPIDIPIMSAAKANDNIITGMVDDMEDVNIWNAMGKAPHWWKVDLGAEYYIDRVEIVWPQHIDMLNVGPMAYSIESAKDFKQTFDVFSESYQVAVNQESNTVIGTTSDSIAKTARFIRVKLLKTQTFADAPIVGKYPIYGAEEISVIGGLLKSDTIDINYKNKTISAEKLHTVADALKLIQPITGGSIKVVNANNTILSNEAMLDKHSQLIVTDKSNTLSERYFFAN